MDKLPQDKRRRAAHSADRNERSETTDGLRPGWANRSGSSGFRRPRTAYIDDIATYLHIGLVTMTTESKPPGVHWWSSAFQLAKEWKLNNDPELPVSGAYHAPKQAATDVSVSTYDHSNATEYSADMSDVTSPMSVSDHAIVESSDPRPVVLTHEEREERRRIWWTLYIFDRHLALRYNAVITIKDAESQDVHLPMDDDTWQATTGSVTPNSDALSNSRPRGPPSTVTGSSIFDLLVPLMCILGQIVDMHHVAYHPRVERRSSNLVADAYTATITQQLNELAPSIMALASVPESFATMGSARSHDVIQHGRLMCSYAHFMLNLLYSLLGGSWDKLTLFEAGYEMMQTARFPELLQRSLAAADCLNDTLQVNPDLGFKAMVSWKRQYSSTYANGLLTAVLRYFPLSWSHTSVGCCQHLETNHRP